MAGRLQGKVAIITGGGSGIGGAMAVRFAREGASVLIADIDAERSANVIDEIQRSGGAATYAKLDVREKCDAADMVATAVAEYGHLDVLVNNVGGSRGDDMLGDLDEETWDFNFTFSLKPTFFCTKAALPELLKRTGDRPHAAIVNLSSLTGLTAMGLPAYAAAKAGVVLFTQNLAIQYGARGITSNVIAPGTTITGNWTPAFAADPGLHDRLAALYPVARLGRPDDIANAALYLASDEATFVNGTTLVVDGGYMAGNDSFIKASVADGDTHDVWGRETGNA
jgi:NAD(P)-dependent dehydrogenase (short-subunit alcohol dehydrogenase family)